MKGKKHGRPGRQSSPITKTFADVLEDLVMAEKNSHSISQNDIASKMGVANSVLSAWLNDAKTPSLENLVKMADHFGVSTDFLLGRKNFSDIDPDVGAVFEKMGLPAAAFNFISLFTDEQKAGLRALFSSPAILRFLETAARCDTSYQKARDLVLQAEAQHDPDLALLSEIPEKYRADIAIMLVGHQSLCK